MLYDCRCVAETNDTFYGEELDSTYQGPSRSANMASLLHKTKDALNKAKSGDPVAHISSKAGAEDFWPASLEVESKKAARMLRTFFTDGFVVPYRTLNSIPNEVSKLDAITQECL